MSPAAARSVPALGEPGRVAPGRAKPNQACGLPAQPAAGGPRGAARLSRVTASAWAVRTPARCTAESLPGHQLRPHSWCPICGSSRRKNGKRIPFRSPGLRHNLLLHRWGSGEPACLWLSLLLTGRRVYQAFCERRPLGAVPVAPSAASEPGPATRELQKRSAPAPLLPEPGKPGITNQRALGLCVSDKGTDGRSSPLLFSVQCQVVLQHLAFFSRQCYPEMRRFC